MFERYYRFIDSRALQGTAVDTAKITTRGQITIPKRVREMMAVESGDVLVFEFDDRRGVRVIPVRKVGRPLKGFLAEYADHRKLDDRRIRSALRQRAARKHTQE